MQLVFSLVHSCKRMSDLIISTVNCMNAQNRNDLLVARELFIDLFNSVISM